MPSKYKTKGSWDSYANVKPNRFFKIIFTNQV